MIKLVRKIKKVKKCKDGKHKPVVYEVCSFCGKGEGLCKKCSEPCDDEGNEL